MLVNDRQQEHKKSKWHVVLQKQKEEEKNDIFVCLKCFLYSGCTLHSTQKKALAFAPLEQLIYCTVGVQAKHLSLGKKNTDSLDASLHITLKVNYKFSFDNLLW